MKSKQVSIGFIQGYYRYAIVAVVFTLIGLFICSGNAMAGSMNDFEVGLSGDMDFTEIQDTQFKPTVYTTGELDLDYGIVDWNASVDVSGDSTIEGDVGVYYRVYKKGSIEFLAGMVQPFEVGDENSLSDTRTWKLRIRKPY